MKINIVMSAADARYGYVTVSAVADTPADHHAPPEALDDVAMPGQVTELLANNVIDFFHPDRVDAMLDHWVTRLAAGGTLSIGGVDLYAVADGLLNGSLGPAEANRLLYGNQDHPWERRRAAYTPALLADALRSRGLSIVIQRHENYRAFVLAEKP